MSSQDAPLVDIGEIVRRTGVATSTLHVWEDREVLVPVGRVGLRRQYSADSVERIAVIQLCQRSGFTLAEIAELLRPGAFRNGKESLAQKLTELKMRRAELDSAIVGIEHALSCSHESPLDCPNFRAKLPVR